MALMYQKISDGYLKIKALQDQAQSAFCWAVKSVTSMCFMILPHSS